MKKLTIGLFFVFVFTSNIVCAAEKQSNRDKDIEIAMIAASKEVNARLPMMLNDDIRLDFTKTVGKQLHSEHTLIKVDVNEIDKVAFKNEMRSLLAKNQCSNDKMVKLLKMGAIHFYKYQDRNGDFIAAIKISKKDCGL